jgi:RNA polymerase sigma factor (sigma-70 family)
MIVQLTQPDDDISLLTAFRHEESKERAFTAILKKYSERLYWHIRRLVINHDDTHDVLQNVSIKAWKALADFREEAHLYTWLYRIATNESLSFLEAQKRRATLSLSDHESALEQKLVAEKGYDARKIEWKLQQAIQSLPEKQRVVFNLRYYDEMPYEQMSEVTGTSIGALKASYHHAVKKVEAFFKEHAN